MFNGVVTPDFLLSQCLRSVMFTHDGLFVLQLFERELRRWAGQEKHMSLSSHALYDSKQVSHIGRHVSTKST